MILNLDVGSYPKHHLWTREEYYKMAELGLFDQNRVELLEGQVIEMSPMNEPHAIGLGLVSDVLREVFQMGYHIREQLPFVINENTELEPDIVVVRGARRDYLDRHPSDAVLIVEIAESTLAYDRQIKRKIYARAGIPEYWILNLVNRQLEVSRDLRQESYHSITNYSVGNLVSPLERPKVQVAIVDLLP